MRKTARRRRPVSKPDPTPYLEAAAREIARGVREGAVPRRGFLWGSLRGQSVHLRVSAVAVGTASVEVRVRY